MIKHTRRKSSECCGVQMYRLCYAVDVQVVPAEAHKGRQCDVFENFCGCSDNQCVPTQGGKGGRTKLDQARRCLDRRAAQQCRLPVGLEHGLVDKTYTKKNVQRSVSPLFCSNARRRGTLFSNGMLRMLRGPNTQAVLCS